ncbi:MAG: LysR family transcriptional regulator [Sporomusaceae bacterium]|nr:LysR family transcriptional regulator [Sporomusaceae bacterium]
MDLRQLKYMLMVAEEKNFSRAAEKLYIAQPHLSQYIQKIEKQLGVKLFDRSCSPLKLTYAGEEFAKRARQIIQMDSNLLQYMRDFKEEKSGRLTLGISPVRGAYILPIILPAFRTLFSQVEIVLKEGTSDDLENWLNQGVTDLTILSLPIKSDEFSYEVILQEKFLVVVPPNHCLAKRPGYDENPPPLQLAELEKEPFILLQKGQALRRIADHLFLQAGYRPNIILETRSYETAHNLASIGMGFTFSTMTVYQTYNNINHPVRLFTAEPSFTRTLAIVYRKGKYLTKFEQAFINLTKEIVQLKASSGIRQE